MKKQINPDKKAASLERRLAELEKREKKLNALVTDLRNSQKIYKSIFDRTGTLIVIFDQDTIIQMLNSECLKKMKYRKRDVIGRMSWTEFVAPEDIERMLRAHMVRSTDPQNAQNTHEFRVRNRLGQSINVLMTIDMIPGTSMRIASLMDITDRIKAEEALLHVSERERQKIGQDLHDDLTPHLMGIEFLSKVFYERIRNISSKDAALAGKMHKLIQDAVEKTKRLARGLSPVFITGYNLVSSLKELAVSTEQIYSTVCSFAYRGTVKNFNLDTSTQLFNIASEAVHNAVKHGKAKSISIELMYGRDTIMIIRDDGKGFNTGKSSQGMGLKIMEYRSRLIKAVLQLKSESGAGTEITITLPGRKTGVRPS